MQSVTPEEVGLSSSGLRRIEEHLSERYLTPGKLAGTLTLIARRGRIAYASSLGSMDRERNKPMRDDVIFRIYSMTKPITSVAIMMLHERGAFQLSDPVHRWIPEFEHLRVYRAGRYPAFVTEPVLRPMTIRDLLTHQSGLTYGFMERTGLDAAYRKLKIDGRYQGTLQTWVRELSQLPLEFSPGARWNYSVSTDVLGHLVEAISGEPFDVYLRRRIFEPLGMRDTAFSVAEDKLERFAANYAIGRDGKLALLDDPADSAFGRPTAFFSGGGGLVSTAADYLRFCELMRRGGELDGVRLLGPRTVRYMTSNHIAGNRDMAEVALGSFGEMRYEGSGFGLGFSVMLDPVRAQTPSSVGEYGWGGMASTAFWVDPQEDLSVVFMTQLTPSSTYPLRSELRNIVYGAIIA
ncbi:MAG: serine hydrolase domain-containing protein [Polyangiales bacterium]